MMDIDIRYLPNQDPGDILEEIRAIPDLEVKRRSSSRRPRLALEPVRARAVGDARPHSDGASVSVGATRPLTRSFLRAGIPAVEFGPCGAGHHGPEEWVSIRSLARYRELLVAFAGALPARLAEAHAAARGRGRGSVKPAESVRPAWAPKLVLRALRAPRDRRR